MTTQQTPHTPPLWRRVISLPTTRLGWWAVGLAAVSVVLLTFAVAAVISPFAFKALGIELEWILWSLFFSWVASGVVGMIALLRGQEHSWIVVVVAILGVLTFLALPILPFAIQGVLYDLHSPWYSP